jgi:hypothetical protein
MNLERNIKPFWCQKNIGMILHLLLICCLSATCLAAQLEIHPPGTSGKTDWDGSCTSPTCGIACRWPSGVSTRSDTSGNCDILLQYGLAWPPFISWSSTVASVTTVSFTSGLIADAGGTTIVLSTSGPIQIFVGTLNRVSVNVTSAGNILVEGGNFQWDSGSLQLTSSMLSAAIVVRKFSFVSTPISIKELSIVSAQSFVFDTLQFSNPSPFSASTSIIWSASSASAISRSITFKDCVINIGAVAPPDNFLQLHRVANITVQDSTIHVNKNFVVSMIDVVKEIVLNNSQVNFAQYFLSQPDNLGISPFATLIYANNSYITGVPDSDLVILYPTITGHGIRITSVASYWVNVAIPIIFELIVPAILVSDQTIFLDCRIHISNVTTLWSMNSVQFHFTVPSYEPVLAISNTSGHAINMRAFGDSASMVNLRFSGVVNFLGESSLRTPNMALLPQSQVTIAHLYLEKLISSSETIADSTNRPTIQSSASSSNSTWQLSTMTVSDVFLNLTHVDYFIYTLSDPSTSLIGINPIGNAELSPLPTSIRIEFQTTPPPQDLSIYHISFFGTSQPGQTFNAIYYPEDPFHFSTFFNESTRLLDFSLYVAPPPQVAPVPAPTPPITIPTSLTCPSPYPTGFICIDGILLATGSILEPTVVFQPNSGVVQVNGNLTVLGTITFNGLGSSVNITGCANIPNIQIVLPDGKSPASIPKEPILLVTQGEDCADSLLNVQITLKQQKSCKKTTATVAASSTSSSLSVLFHVDSSSCNTKWIILGSVLGAVILISVIVALVFTLNPTAKACIRPYVARKNDKPQL